MNRWECEDVFFCGWPWVFPGKTTTGCSLEDASTTGIQVRGGYQELLLRNTYINSQMGPLAEIQRVSQNYGDFKESNRWESIQISFAVFF